jgi:lycopene beta-cyclase
MVSCDVLIAGGGLSGLTLAYYLHQFAPQLDVKVIESRSTYTQDKHWGFWRKKEAAFDFEDVIYNRYDQWKVANPYKEVCCRSDAYQYCIIRSEDWYNYVMKELANKIITNSKVVQISHQHIQTETTTYRAPLVFDSTHRGANASTFFQQFTGWLIESEDVRFDTRTMTLMDFRISQPKDACGFLYVLPFGEGKVLIEPTVFTKKIMDTTWFEHQLKEWLNLNAIKNFTLLEKETGLLPMKLIGHSITVNQAYPIGNTAGWMRASTGYAFLNTIRLGKLLAQHIATTRALLKQPLVKFSPSALWLDKVFLKVMSRHPETLPVIFSDWFAKLPSEDIIHFLQDESDLVTNLNLIAHTTHKHLFLKNLWRD